MTLTVSTVLALAIRCAPSVAPETLLSVVQVESGLEPFAIGVNGVARSSQVAATRDQAVAVARAHIASGRSVDLGLAQINSKNLAWLGLTIDQAFEPCANLAAAARILSDSYARGNASRVGVQPALQTALSLYNTGDPRRGFANGYVAKVLKAAGRYASASLAGPADRIAGPSPGAFRAASPWEVFGKPRAVRGELVFISEPSAIGGAP